MTKKLFKEDVQEQIDAVWDAVKRKISRGEDPLNEIKIVRNLENLTYTLESEDAICNFIPTYSENTLALLEGKKLQLDLRYSNGNYMNTGDVVIYTYNNVSKFGRIEYCPPSSFGFVEYDINTLKRKSEQGYRSLVEGKYYTFISSDSDFSKGKLKISDDLFVTCVNQYTNYADNLYLGDEVEFASHMAIRTRKVGRIVLSANVFFDLMIRTDKDEYYELESCTVFKIIRTEIEPDKLK